MKNEEKIELLYNEEYLPKEKEQKRTVLLSKVSPKIENFIEKTEEKNQQKTSYFFYFSMRFFYIIIY